MGLMNRWLFKTEPSDYSFDDLQNDGRTTWEGVRNALALIHLRKVKKGDEIAVYHTGKAKAVVGIARAVADARGDHVDIAAVRAVTPVPLSALKSNPRFRNFELIRISRLSVMPVPDGLWKELTVAK